jgi:hypothetical protein
MFEFIKQELTEARMFRLPISLEGNNAHALARVLYLGLLSIELIRHFDEETARTYCYRTIQYGDFDHMRTSGTDVGNIIAVLGNQKDFEHRMIIDLAISAPLLQVNTYLRGVWLNTFQHGRDRQFFMNLESALGINESLFYQIRRTVVDWNLHSKNDHKAAISNIRRELMRHATRLDIIEFLPKI